MEDRERKLSGRRSPTSLVSFTVLRERNDGETELVRITRHELLLNDLARILQQVVFRRLPMVDRRICASIELVQRAALLDEAQKVKVNILPRRRRSRLPTQRELLLHGIQFSALLEQLRARGRRARRLHGRREAGERRPLARRELRRRLRLQQPVQQRDGPARVLDRLADEQRLAPRRGIAGRNLRRACAAERARRAQGGRQREEEQDGVAGRRDEIEQVGAPNVTEGEFRVHAERASKVGEDLRVRLERHPACHCDTCGCGRAVSLWSEGGGLG